MSRADVLSSRPQFSDFQLNIITSACERDGMRPRVAPSADHFQWYVEDRLCRGPRYLIASHHAFRQPSAGMGAGVVIGIEGSGDVEEGDTITAGLIRAGEPR